MTNKEIAKKFELTAYLLELHDSPTELVKLYTNALYRIEQIEQPIAECSSIQAITALGFSKALAEQLYLLVQERKLPLLDELISKTPAGLIKMRNVSGLGAKKVKILWKEAKIDSLDALELACRVGAIATIKGFGEKTQQQILESIEFLKKNSAKLRINDADKWAKMLYDWVVVFQTQQQVSPRAEIVGQLARSCEVVETIDLVVGYPFLYEHYLERIKNTEWLTWSPALSTPYILRGRIQDTQTPFQLIVEDDANWVNTIFRYTASQEHQTTLLPDGRTLVEIVKNQVFTSQEAIYQQAQLPYIIPEMREGSPLLVKEQKAYITYQDLKGVFHNHSTYSDGKNSLREMAIACRDLGFQYLGITDHSVSAFYANGLSVDRIVKQHQEIDQLNAELAPFRIFKGIESDILQDGSLDYSNDVLATFDFIVASIHSGMKMDKDTATHRILKAIQNPYTTMLGHSTGRLLLEREGYPLDMEAVINACAEYDVVIEINANPYRLDMDWRWVQIALQKNVVISINPDAHSVKGYADIDYGVRIGRKAGLTPPMTLNAKSLDEITLFFEKRKFDKKL